MEERRLAGRVRLLPRSFRASLTGSVSYYVQGQERAQRVSELFSSIASRYDLINDIQSFGLHRWWKHRLVKLAPAGPDRQALDVCCGTGDLTLALADRGYETTGIDFNEPMLRVARRRGSQRPGARPVRFVHGDALQLPFADASFSVVTVAYGLRNLADVDQGLRELVRVLRPGGTLLILEFGKPESAPLRWLWFGYLRLALPVYGFLFARDAKAYAYILESLLHYPGQTVIQSKLAGLGAADGKMVHLLGGMMSMHVVRKAG